MTVKYEFAGALYRCKGDWLEAITEGWLGKTRDVIDLTPEAVECRKAWFTEIEEMLVEHASKESELADLPIEPDLDGYVPGVEELAGAFRRHLERVE